VRIAILGGTRFIGRAIVEALAAEHEVVVVHRGVTEPEGLPEVEHVHVDRADLGPEHLDGVEAIVDTLAMTAADAVRALAAAPADARLVVLSSGDVYRAYTALHAGEQSEAVPLDEESPVREARYPYGTDYEKLDVEPRYLERGGTVLRLGFVYGEHDHQRREDFVLARVRAGRPRIPIGPGSWLMSRVYVRDVAHAVERGLRTDAARGEVFNVCEQRTWPVREWARRIVEAAGARAELVTVPESALPELDLTGSVQHMLMSNAKARAVLGFTETDPEEALQRSVRWHMAHPPEDDDFDAVADEAALRAASA
jgi:nucleoside-diphosphate-sugar epimerase